MTQDPPGTTGQQAERLLSDDALARILAAPQLPRSVPLSDEALARVLDILLQYAVATSLKKRSSVEAHDRVEEAYFRFLKATREVNPFDAAGPPNIPLTFQDDMIRWMKSRQAARPKAAREVNQFRAKLYTILLSFYEACFGCAPMTGTGSLAARFVHAVFREVRGAIVEEPEMKLRGLRPSVMQLAREAWTQPSDSAIRRATRDFRDQASWHPSGWVLIAAEIMKENPEDGGFLVAEWVPALREIIERAKTTAKQDSSGRGPKPQTGR